MFSLGLSDHIITVETSVSFGAYDVLDKQELGNVRKNVLAERAELSRGSHELPPRRRCTRHAAKAVDDRAEHDEDDHPPSEPSDFECHRDVFR